MKQLDANTLVAYADGELDIEAAALVEARLAEDAEAREIVSRLREAAALVHAAHAHVLHEAVPDRLLDLFDGVPVADELNGDSIPSRLVNLILNAPEGDVAQEPAAAATAGAAPVISLARRRSIAMMATAALFAAVMVGGGMTFQKYITGVNQAGTTHQVRVSAAMEDPWREAAFQEALETKKSQTAVLWSNPESGRSGVVVPVKTYRRDDGTFCRAFRTVDTGAAPDLPNYGVACREPGDDGRWIKKVETMAAPGEGAKLQF